MNGEPTKPKSVTLDGDPVRIYNPVTRAHFFRYVTARSRAEAEHGLMLVYDETRKSYESKPNF